MSITKQQLNFLKENFQKVEQEYHPETRENEGSFLIRKIWNLTATERQTIILYAECNSYKAVGELLGLHPQTISYRLKKIKEKLCRVSP